MADQWYVGKDGDRTGPFTSSQVRQLAATGELRPGDLLWKEGMADWVQAATVRGLFATPAAAPPVPAVVPTTNPYAAPAVNDFEVADGPSGTPGRPPEYADFLPRVGAALLDGLFLFVMNCVPAFGIGLAFAILAGDDRGARESAAVFANIVAQLLGIVIAVAYYVVLETSPKQGTWGKQIVGIKVTDLEGNRLTVGRALGRYFAKIISYFTCSIGFLMPLFTQKRQTLHDMIAGCLALKK